MDALGARRVLIHAVTGSGKTTLARRLGAATGLPGRIVDRREICNGNRETLRQVFSRESIIVWHFKSFGSKRRQLAAWTADPAGPRIVRFTRPRDLELWLQGLTRPSRR